MEHKIRLALPLPLRWALKDAADWLLPRLARLGWGFVAGFLTGLIYATIVHMHQAAGGIR